MPPAGADVVTQALAAGLGILYRGPLTQRADMEPWKMVLLQNMHRMEQMLEDCRQKNATDEIKTMSSAITGSDKVDFRRVATALKRAISKLEATISEGEES